MSLGFEEVEVFMALRLIGLIASTPSYAFQWSFLQEEVVLMSLISTDPDTVTPRMDYKRICGQAGVECLCATPRCSQSKSLQHPCCKHWQ